VLAASQSIGTIEAKLPENLGSGKIWGQSKNLKFAVRKIWGQSKNFNAWNPYSITREVFTLTPNFPARSFYSDPKFS
jgi:hypothetical protein